MLSHIEYCRHVWFTMHGFVTYRGDILVQRRGSKLRLHVLQILPQ